MRHSGVFQGLPQQGEQCLRLALEAEVGGVRAVNRGLVVVAKQPGAGHVGDARHALGGEFFIKVRQKTLDSLFRMARKAEHVGVCGLSWLDFECVYRLVWLSFGLFDPIGFREKSDKKRPRFFGLSLTTPCSVRTLLAYFGFLRVKIQHSLPA